MNTYIISYDLNEKQNYDGLYNKIKDYKTWAKITESTWAIKTNNSAVEVRDSLKQVIKDDDNRLFVIKSGLEAAWSNVIGKNEWFQKNL